MHRMMVLSSVKHPGKEWKEGALGLDFTHQDYERVSRLTLAYQRAKECTRVYKHAHTCRPEDNAGCCSLGAVHLDFDKVFLTDFELRVRHVGWLVRPSGPSVCISLMLGLHPGSCCLNHCLKKINKSQVEFPPLSNPWLLQKDEAAMGLSLLTPEFVTSLREEWLQHHCLLRLLANHSNFIPQTRLLGKTHVYYKFLGNKYAY